MATIVKSIGARGIEGFQVDVEVDRIHSKSNRSRFPKEANSREFITI